MKCYNILSNEKWLSLYFPVESIMDNWWQHAPKSLVVKCGFFFSTFSHSLWILCCQRTSFSLKNHRGLFINLSKDNKCIKEIEYKLWKIPSKWKQLEFCPAYTYMKRLGRNKPIYRDKARLFVTFSVISFCHDVHLWSSMHCTK